MHIYLIGYRGAGKSTVGRLVAQQLGLTFVDTDDWIEERAGRSIREIFQAEGEDGFRDLEQGVIEEAAQNWESKAAVISLGGGAILRDANRRNLQASGRCVYLAGSPEVLYERIHGDASSRERRPNLSDSGGFAEVKEILSVRIPIYDSLANLKVNTDTQTPDAVVAEIVDWVESSGG